MTPNQVVPMWHIKRQRPGDVKVALAITTLNNVNDRHHQAFNVLCVILAPLGIWCAVTIFSVSSLGINRVNYYYYYYYWFSIFCVFSDIFVKFVSKPSTKFCKNLPKNILKTVAKKFVKNFCLIFNIRK